MYACSFFGHGDTPKEIEPALRSALIDITVVMAYLPGKKYGCEEVFPLVQE